MKYANEDALDDSWDSVPIQHVRAVAPVRASIRFATPRPFKADCVTFAEIADEVYRS